MAKKKYTHIPQFADFRGIDLRSSDVQRQRGFSSDGTRNVMHSPQGAVVQRPGSKIIQRTYGGLGVFPFKQVNILGTERSEIVGFGADSAANSAKPYRLVESTFTLTNSHATLAATVSHYYDTTAGVFKFKVVRGGSTLTDYSLDSLTLTLVHLEAQLDGLTSFSMSTPTSAANVTAYFIQLLNEETIAANGGTLTVKYWYWEEIGTNHTASTAFSLINYAYELGLNSFEIVSAVTLNNVLYFSCGIHTNASLNGNTPVKKFFILKYDGQAFTRIGMQEGYRNSGSSRPAVSTTQTDVRGAFARSAADLPGAHLYKSQLVWRDKAGNFIEGDISKSSHSRAAGSAGEAVLLTDVYEGSTHGIHRAAKKNGNEQTLTPTVDSGHNMTAGDIGYFWDQGQERFIQREITATTSTSLTFSSTPIDTDESSPTYDDGSVPTWRDDATISANLRVRLWRTKDGGSEFYWLDEIPVSGFSAYVDDYYDNKPDSELTDAYIAPTYPRSRKYVPNEDLTSADFVDVAGPGGKYLATFNSLLLVSGDTLRPNTVYFSDIDGPEYFPAGTHELDLPEPVTGMGQCGEVLLIFSAKKTYAVTGSLSEFNFRVDEIAEIGCTAHASIQKLEEGVLVWQSARGPYVSYGGRRVEPLGAKVYPDGAKVSRLEPFFTQVYSSGQDAPVFKRATSAILPKERLYLLYVPYEDPDFPSYATSSGVLWVYDFGRDAWWKWDGWNCAGGMAVLDDDLYFSQRSHDGAGTAYADAVVRLHQRQIALPRTNTASDAAKYNYADHDSAITAVWRSHWESLGKPSEFKRGLRVRLSSHETRIASSTQMELNTYVDYATANTSNADTLTWTTQKDLKPKIKGEVCRSMMYELKQSGLYYQPMLISGLEPEFVADFKPGAGFKE